VKNIFIASVLTSIFVSLFFISDKAIASEKQSVENTKDESIKDESAPETRAFPYTLNDLKQLQKNYKIEDYHFTEFNLDDNEQLKAAYLKAGDIEAGGLAGEQNLDKAIYWFEQAAKLGLVEAMHRLGDFHQFEV